MAGEGVVAVLDAELAFQGGLLDDQGADGAGLEQGHRGGVGVVAHHGELAGGPREDRACAAPSALVSAAPNSALTCGWEVMTALVSVSETVSGWPVNWDETIEMPG